MFESADFSIKPTLTGTRVVLRPFISEDLDAILTALRDPDVRRLTGSVHDDTTEITPEDPAETRRLRDWYATREAQPDRLDLAIVEVATARCVGEAVLNQWDPGNRSCNFRILIGPGGQGRGLGTEATRLIVGYGFETLGLHRISLEVYAFNPRARRSYEKAGFRPEGVLRESLRYGDRWIDATVMSILAREWAEHRGYPESAQPAGESGQAPRLQEVGDGGGDSGDGIGQVGRNREGGSPRRRHPVRR
ncbi:GNAT family N-acetyltransferase [Nocardia aurantiaca]|uniref:GNAT family N-acetyltransferase n=1 Tax=Nocardia aurantiaca TaxID=2675850 RepID=A0A6I3KRB6_9NOCA|nr:GNAT family N-acetyltransferase [Nocardia aurantiaca]